MHPHLPYLASQGLGASPLLTLLKTVIMFQHNKKRILLSLCLLLPYSNGHAQTEQVQESNNKEVIKKTSATKSTSQKKASAIIVTTMATMLLYHQQAIKELQADKERTQQELQQLQEALKRAKAQIKELQTNKERTQQEIQQTTVDALGFVSIQHRDVVAPDSLEYILVDNTDALQVEELTKLIQGFNLWEKIMQGSNPHLLKQQCALLMRTVDHYARCNGQSFDEGTFCIPDPEKHIWNAFQSITSQRLSSHLPGLSTESHRGINFSFHIGGQVKRTLLIITYSLPDGTSMVLLKPENAPVLSWQHLIEFFFPPQGNMASRKERTVPIENIFGNPPLIDEYDASQYKKKGISYLLTLNLTPGQRNKLKNYCMENQLDCEKHRIGREVIINPEDFRHLREQLLIESSSPSMHT